VRDVSGTENQNILLCSITLFSENCAICEKNVEKRGTARNAADESVVQSMHIACWITKATNTHTEYVILIDFPLQVWLHESN
jgi:hypothetical protein